MITLKPPLMDKDVEKLEVGDSVKISGKIITARDEAYERILEFFEEGKDLPVNFENGVVYHCGPLVEKREEGWNIVSAGPTTSGRLDEVQADFVKKTGTKTLIGKGGVGKEVVPEISAINCVYLSFTGGAAALAADSIESIEDVFWKDLGLPEALWVLEVEEFGPLTVSVDTSGRDLYH